MNVEKVDSIRDLDKIVSNNQDFILELSKEHCPYCNIMNRAEKKITLNKSVKIYKLVITDEVTSQEINHLKEYLQPLRYVPAFYHIKNGRTIKYLYIHDWEKPQEEVASWIKQNQ